MLFSQVVIKDTMAITPSSAMERKTSFSSSAQTCYNIIYELNTTAVKTPRPRVIFITSVRIDTLVYCTSVFNCGVFGLFDNSTYPIGPVTTLEAQVNITYSEGANASGTVVSYPTVEIRPTATRPFDVKTLEVILHYDPVYYVPADIVFGYVHFRIAPVTPPVISITFPGEDTTIVVTDTYLPTIVMKEIHTPNDAIVTWTPSNSISAAEYITSAIAETTVTVNATVTRPCGGEQTAQRKITFKKEVVKITLTAEKGVLLPLLDRHNKKADPDCTVPKGATDTCRRILDFSKVDKTKLTVTVVDGSNNPLSDYSLTVHALVRKNWGGHDHSNDRPKGRFVLGNDTSSTVETTTDAEGKVRFEYLCSGFGGVDSIFAKGKTQNDTASLAIPVKIENLVELSAGTTYVLVGAFGESGVNSQHKKNHYGTANLVTKLKALADSTHADSSYVLRFNDMSLQFGGPFDINNNWDIPHQKHREGKSADIDNVDNRGKEISPGYLRKKLQIIDPKSSLGNEGNHYHVTIR